MTLQKKDLIVLAADTLSWATKNDYTKIDGSNHSYFTIGEWCDYFEYSNYTFKKVKIQMVESGIMIAQRVGYGHYISDSPVDTVTNFELNLKNIITRLETHLAMFDSAIKSKHSKELVKRLEEIVEHLNIQLDTEGMLTLPESKTKFLETSIVQG